MAIPIPLSSSDVRIFSNVPFTRDYQHVRYWNKNVTAQNNYFNSLTPIYSAEKVSFVKHNLYDGVFYCRLPIDQLKDANYMWFKNAGLDYYCFIDNMEYENNGNTAIYFSVDIMQTYQQRINVLVSQVEREHTQLYSGGSPVINTLPEKIYYGDEYEVKEVTRIQPYDGLLFMVIVCKEAFHTDSSQVVTPTNNGIPQPFSYYIHPFFVGGESPEIKIGGVGATYSDLKTVLECMYNQQNAVENVVTMYITDNPGLVLNFDGTTCTFNTGQVEKAEFIYDSKYAFTLYVKQASEYTAYVKNLGDKYSGLGTLPNESKLLMYPYTVYILTDLQGNQVEIKPEHIIGNELQIEMIGSMGTSNKTAYRVVNYNVPVLMENEGFAGYQNALICNNPTSVPVVSDYLSAFLQGNANSLKASRDAMLTNSLFSIAGSTIGGIASAATGNIAGGVGSAFGALEATKDGLLGFKQQNALIKDISNIPPNVNSQGNNPNFDFGNGLTGVFLIKKQIKQEYINKLNGFFKKYGYEVNEFKVPNLNTREHWNYVKLTSANINGTIPAEILTQIKQIFERGVTLWHTNDMLNYNTTNN